MPATLPDAMQIIGWGPAWAVGTQDCIKHFPVPPRIEAVAIFADADDSGPGLTASRVMTSMHGLRALL